MGPLYESSALSKRDLDSRSFLDPLRTRSVFPHNVEGDYFGGGVSFLREMEVGGGDGVRCWWLRTRVSMWITISLKKMN